MSAIEPYGYAFQHEETGLEQVVDIQQVEWGFEKNNPRWQKIGLVYPEAALAAKDAEIERLKDLNADAHGIVARIWSILGNPSYDDLNGRTIYDLVQQQRDALRSLVSATADFHEAAMEHLSDTTFDSDGILAEREAELSVVALPEARAAIAGGSV